MKIIKIVGFKHLMVLNYLNVQENFEKYILKYMACQYQKVLHNVMFYFYSKHLRAICHNVYGSNI